MKFASLDKIQYRLKVFGLLRSNKAKYPVFNELMKNATDDGIIDDLMPPLIALFDGCFEENLTIATCASSIEEMSALGRKRGEELFTQVLMDISANETKH